MAILNTAGIQRKPTHPGKMLREDFLPDYGLTVSGLAESLGVARQSVDELLRERRAVSPEMALRLARLFGNTPEFWLNTQRSVDITMPCTGGQNLRFAAVLSPVIAGVSFLAKQWRSNESKNDSRYRNGIGDAGRKISSL